MSIRTLLSIALGIALCSGCAEDDVSDPMEPIILPGDAMIDAAVIDAGVPDLAVLDAAMPDALPPLILGEPAIIDLEDLPPISIQPSVALGPDGEIAVAWCGSVEEDLGIWFTLLNPDGSVRVDTFALETTSMGIQNEPDVCALPGGGYAVIWSMDAQEAGPAGQNLYIRYRVVGADGQPITESDVELTTTPGNHWLTEVACDPSGGFMVVGTGPEENMTFGVFAQRFDANGEALSEAVTLNVDPDGTQVFPSVDIGPDGAAVVAWEDQTGFGTDTVIKQVVSRRIEAGEAGPNTPRVVLTDPSEEAGRPDVSIDPLTGDALISVTLDQQRIGLYRLPANGGPPAPIQPPAAVSYYGALTALGDGRHGMLYLSGVGQNVTARVVIIGTDGIVDGPVDLASGNLPPYPTTTDARAGRMVSAWTERTDGNGFRIRLALFENP
jgi:hypothetical protein